ncbi:hypothetical protein L210DRAFT_3559179 [Boletus edulis BED1]|uniref:Uncharacterized protein n=1 Tax=Boletus edulis BED1 TaxID=1328754 RepID=A0AAD4BJ33_BOLED|nr:hypothetical protein L210DRAFT_3559179 [Boletus edulis BED1]
MACHVYSSTLTILQRLHALSCLFLGYNATIASRLCQLFLPFRGLRRGPRLCGYKYHLVTTLSAQHRPGPGL